MLPQPYTPETLERLATLQSERVMIDPGILPPDDPPNLYLMGVWAHSGELARFMISYQQGGYANEAEVHGALRRDGVTASGKLTLNLLYFCVSQGINMPEMISDVSLIDGYDRDYFQMREQPPVFLVSRAYGQLESAHFAHYRSHDIRSRAFNLFYALHLFSAQFLGRSALDCLLEVKKPSKAPILTRKECTFSYCPNAADCQTACTFPREADSCHGSEVTGDDSIITDGPAS